MSALEEVSVPAGEGAPETASVAMIPPGATKGVVVIHEIFGRQPEIDRAVERFARAGYAAVAPDLFRRGRLTCLRDVFVAMRTGGGPAVQQGLNARAWLCARAGIEPRHVGLVGFCFGGGYALAAGAGWGAVSANYGAVPSKRAMQGIGPVIACYGRRDKVMSVMPGRLRRRLAAVGQSDCEVRVFDGVGHSFLTDGKPHFVQRFTPMGFGDNPEVREGAWGEIFAFLDRHLS